MSDPIDLAFCAWWNSVPPGDGYPTVVAFKAGWNARDAEVARLREKLKILTDDIAEFAIVAAAP